MRYCAAALLVLSGCLDLSGDRPACFSATDCPSGQRCEDGQCVASETDSEDLPDSKTTNDASLPPDPDAAPDGASSCALSVVNRQRIEVGADIPSTEAFGPSLVFNGAEFGVAFVDAERGDIMGRSLDFDGNPIGDGSARFGGEGQAKPPVMVWAEGADSFALGWYGEGTLQIVVDDDVTAQLPLGMTPKPELLWSRQNASFLVYQFRASASDVSLRFQSLDTLGRPDSNEINSGLILDAPRELDGVVVVDVVKLVVEASDGVHLVWLSDLGVLNGSALIGPGQRHPTIADSGSGDGSFIVSAFDDSWLGMQDEEGVVVAALDLGDEILATDVALQLGEGLVVAAVADEGPVVYRVSDGSFAPEHLTIDDAQEADYVSLAAAGTGRYGLAFSSPENGVEVVLIETCLAE